MDDSCWESSDYEILAEIGQGAYGKVYKARERRGQQRFIAVKRLNIPEEPESGIPQFVIREVALLRKIEHFNHPNIVKLLNVSAGWQNQKFDLTLAFEYIDQDLTAFLSRASEKGLTRDKIKDVMRQLLSGLDFLHTNTVIHRDLKPDNVLVSSRGEVKIADFGLARIYTYHIALTPCVVTLWYRAPEVLLQSSYMSSVDMWSAGCIFAELFLLRPLFRGFTEIQQLQKIFEVIGLPSEEDWPIESPVCYSPAWAEKKPTKQLLPSLAHEENDLLNFWLSIQLIASLPVELWPTLSWQTATVKMNDR
ncbi:cyclin-dependent kinase 6-like isoform X2 [Sinocyclocheilus grahami]|uniref:cyclin-dependent kinase 6-like isoform X2 n=1 Tax=Sinocyclocheilus grahami TaxID=75366 RepID=UPI0007ACACBA|nr:PREDICTED: cyclin-dependent kinase 6-like isoform X2 [Sinocyclocheilus grahami]